MSKPDKSSEESGSDRSLVPKGKLCYRWTLSLPANRSQRLFGRGEDLSTQLNLMGQIDADNESQAVVKLKSQYQEAIHIQVHYYGLTWKQFMSEGERYGWD